MSILFQINNWRGYIITITESRSIVIYIILFMVLICENYANYTTRILGSLYEIKHRLFKMLRKSSCNKYSATALKYSSNGLYKEGHCLPWSYQCQCVGCFPVVITLFVLFLASSPPIYLVIFQSKQETVPSPSVRQLHVPRKSLLLSL